MAEAKRVVVPVKKIVEVDEQFVDIRLTIEEAQFLNDVMGMIGGDQTTSRRKHSIAIERSLRGLVPVIPWADKDDINKEYRSIYFLTKTEQDAK